MNGHITSGARPAAAAIDPGAMQTPFHSVLYASPREFEDTGKPASFDDLNLDQLVDAIASADGEHELHGFFYAPLHGLAEVTYRHQVVNDLGRADIADAIGAYAGAMREMRRRLRIGGGVREPRQRQRWFLAAVDAYCRAVRQLTAGLDDLSPDSAALRGLRAHSLAYVSSDAFIELEADANELLQALAAVRYTVELKGLHVTVDCFGDEPDLTEQVVSTFARFREGAADSHLVSFPESIDANSVEMWILQLVAELNPELFGRLKRFCARYADYQDPTLVRFDREVHFYLGYLAYIEPLRQAGVEFCLPAVSADRKELLAVDACDLVLARKLTADGASIVLNDFELSGPERILVITGPNQGGKTTFSRMFGQLHHLAALGLPVPARRAILFLPDRIFTHFEREEDLSTQRSKFEDELIRIHEILGLATERSVLIMNESFGSTTADDALRVGREVLGRVLALDMTCVCVTFIDELSRLGEGTVSMMSTVDASDPGHRTFRVLRKPADGLAYAVALARRHGLGYEQLKRSLQP